MSSESLNYHQNQDIEHFFPFPKKLPCLLVISPSPEPSQSLASTDMFSVPTTSAFSRMTYKCNHIACNFVSLRIMLLQSIHFVACIRIWDFKTKKKNSFSEYRNSSDISVQKVFKTRLRGRGLSRLKIIKISYTFGGFSPKIYLQWMPWRN